jgi:hypothetical protein
MYFEDLSEYSYDMGVAIRGVRNVGWLDASHEYAKGSIDAAVLEKITTLALQKSVNQMRGFHYCELCSTEELRIEQGGKKRLLGSSELWVPDNAGGYFASPNLVVHYIQAHGYQPPSDYVEAVMVLDAAAWDPPEEIAEVLRAKQ